MGRSSPQERQQLSCNEEAKGSGHRRAGAARQKTQKSLGCACVLPCTSTTSSALLLSRISVETICWRRRSSSSRRLDEVHPHSLMASIPQFNAPQLLWTEVLRNQQAQLVALLVTAVGITGEVSVSMCPKEVLEVKQRVVPGIRAWRPVRRSHCSHHAPEPSNQDTQREGEATHFRRLIAPICGSSLREMREHVPLTLCKEGALCGRRHRQ